MKNMRLLLLTFIPLVLGSNLEGTLVCFPKIEPLFSPAQSDPHLNMPPKLVFSHPPSPDKPRLDYSARVEVTVEFEEVNVENRRKECENKKGVYLSPFCYKFIIPELQFHEARIFCHNLGGDLWVPNLEDPKLFARLAEFLPQVFGASHNTVWVGLTLVGHRFITVQGEDLTETYLGLSGKRDGQDGECAVAHIRTGVVLHTVNCTYKSDFVCELPLTSKDEKVRKKVLKYLYDL